MPETVALSFRDLSIRVASGEKQDSFKSDTSLKLVGLSPGRKRKSFKKRVHLVRNPYICQQCLKFWPEIEAGEYEKRLFYKMKESGDQYLHRRCGGHVLRWYELNGKPMVDFCTRLFSDPELRNFFPSMSNLVRLDHPDTAHHNPACTGTCCHLDRAGSMGPEPAASAAVRLVVSWPTLRGFEEQGAKTCAASSVAGALNAIFWAAPDGDAEEGGGRRPRRKRGRRRVTEQEVLDYYCQWARESGRTACHAALRGSCGLPPSTRKIGNPRLLRAAHAVARQLCDETDPPTPEGGGGVQCPQLQCAEAAGEEEEESEEEEGTSAGSPVEVLRLMGSAASRESIEEGGRCAAGDGPEVEERQWRRLWGEVAGGQGVLVHNRNHYALVFGLREWQCGGCGAWRRQMLTATTRQRPHVWFCFRQLRADVVFSKTNQLLLFRTPRPRTALPCPAPPAAERAGAGPRGAEGSELPSIHRHADLDPRDVSLLPQSA